MNKIIDEMREKIKREALSGWGSSKDAEQENAEYEKNLEEGEALGQIPETGSKRIAHTLEDGSTIFGGIYQTKVESEDTFSGLMEGGVHGPDDRGIMPVAVDTDEYPGPRQPGCGEPGDGGSRGGPGLVGPEPEESSLTVAAENLDAAVEVFKNSLKESEIGKQFKNAADKLAAVLPTDAEVDKASKALKRAVLMVYPFKSGLGVAVPEEHKAVNNYIDTLKTSRGRPAIIGESIDREKYEEQTARLLQGDWDYEEREPKALKRLLENPEDCEKLFTFIFPSSKLNEIIYSVKHQSITLEGVNVRRRMTIYTASGGISVHGAQRRLADADRIKEFVRNQLGYFLKNVL